MRYFIVFLIIICFNVSCIKDKTLPCRDSVYTFNVNSEFLNAKENYQVGDTIRIISEFPTQIQNIRPGGQVVDYRNATVAGTNFICSLLDSVQHTRTFAIENLRFIPLEGRITDSISPVLKTFIYQEKNDKYIFDILIILEKPGRYMFVVEDGGSIGIRGKNCTNADFALKVTNANKNLEIFTNTAIPNTFLDQNVIERIYCLRVK